MSRLLLNVTAIRVKNLISLNKIEKQGYRPKLISQYRTTAFILSWTIVIIGVFSVYANKDKILGIDFKGGKNWFPHLLKELVQPKLTPHWRTEKNMGKYNMSTDHELDQEKDTSRLVLQTEEGKSREILKALNTAHPDASLSEEGLSNIGASVSNQIKEDAILSVVVALLGILLYVTIRFEMGYALVQLLRYT